MKSLANPSPDYTVYTYWDPSRGAPTQRTVVGFLNAKPNLEGERIHAVRAPAGKMAVRMGVKERVAMEKAE